MKRIPELRSLSVDHHHGLVLAHRAKKAADGTGERSLEEMWEEVERAYREEMELHFHIEEVYLGPPLEAVGENRMVERFKEEHHDLRGMVQDRTDRTSETLRRFGDHLERHIRFEERGLFETAQAKLAPEVLKAVEEASQVE